MRDDVLGVLDALDLGGLVLVGHSMGGIVAYLVAQAQPGRVTRLVVEDAPPPFPRDRPVPTRPAGELRFNWAVVPAVVEEINDPSLQWWKHLREITAATLLVGGGPTSHIPQEMLVDVSRAVPDCTLITIPPGTTSTSPSPTRSQTPSLSGLGPAVSPLGVARLSRRWSIGGAVPSRGKGPVGRPAEGPMVAGFRRRRRPRCGRTGRGSHPNPQ